MTRSAGLLGPGLFVYLKLYQRVTASGCAGCGTSDSLAVSVSGREREGREEKGFSA